MVVLLRLGNVNEGVEGDREDGGDDGKDALDVVGGDGFDGLVDAVEETVEEDDGDSYHLLMKRKEGRVRMKGEKKKTTSRITKTHVFLLHMNVHMIGVTTAANVLGL